MTLEFPSDPIEMADFAGASRKYILPGYAPKKPFLSRSAKTVAVGPCFPQHIAEALTKARMAAVHRDNVVAGEPADLLVLSAAPAPDPQTVQARVNATIDVVRALNPDVAVVLTLSHLPTEAGDHPSIFGRDSVAKSCIRVGLEMVLNQGLENVFYWPSYEMVQWLAPHRGKVFWLGQSGPPKTMTDEICGLFIESFFNGPKAVSP